MSPAAEKRPFDIDLAMARTREAIRPFPQAALFALAAEGFDSPFELLMACIISIRTFDEVTLPCAHRLFALARTPSAVSQLTVAVIDETIHPCTFHDAKAKQIHDIACDLTTTHGGILPCDAELLCSFRGVGPKCTNLVLGIACHQPCISVDIHVHRVTNRWGYVQRLPRNVPWPHSQPYCRSSPGWKPTASWSRLGSISVLAVVRAAQPARC